MNLRQIEYFLHVARHGNLSHAATALRMGQPALSRHIRALEVELRRALFHRNGRGVVLTDAGVRFLTYAKAALQQLEVARSALDSADDDLAGKVAVGMPPSVAKAMTVPLVVAFQQRYPRAHIAIGEGLSFALEQKILGGELDLAIMHGPSPSPMLRIEPLHDEELFLLSPSAGPVDPVLLPDEVTMDQLIQLRLIFPPTPHPIRQLVERECHRLGLQLEVALEIEALTAIPQLVQANCGHAIVPESLLWAGLPEDGVSVRRIAAQNLKSKLSLVSAARQQDTLLRDGTHALVLDLLNRLIRTGTAASQESGRCIAASARST